MNDKTQDFLIDNISRSAQVIFAVLVVGPFVAGFSPMVFTAGCMVFALLIAIGLYLASNGGQ